MISVLVVSGELSAVALPVSTAKKTGVVNPEPVPADRTGWTEPANAVEPLLAAHIIKGSTFNVCWFFNKITANITGLDHRVVRQ